MSNHAPKQEPPYGLRMPRELKAKVKAMAEDSNRSMNAEIIAALEEWVERPSVEAAQASAMMERAEMLLVERATVDEKLSQILAKIDKMSKR